MPDAVPSTRRTTTPYLSVRDTRAAIAFYEAAFGAQRVGPLLTLPNGGVAHAEIQIGDATVMLSDENPDWGNVSPLTLGDSPVRIALNVEDADATFSRALEAGAESVIPVSDQFYGERAGRVRDPFGHYWIIGQRIEDLTQAEMQARLDAMIGGADT